MHYKSLKSTSRLLFNLKILSEISVLHNNILDVSYQLENIVHDTKPDRDNYTNLPNL